MRLKIGFSLFLVLNTISYAQETKSTTIDRPTVVREYGVHSKDGIVQKEYKTNMHIKQLSLEGNVLSDELIYMDLGFQNTKTIYHYNKKGKLVVEERKLHSNKYNEYRDHIRITYAYDRKGNCVQKKSKVLANDRWVVSNEFSQADFKKKFKYGKAGNVLTVLEKKWDSIAKKFVGATKANISWNKEKPFSFVSYTYNVTSKDWKLNNTIDSLKWDNTATFSPYEVIYPLDIQKKVMYFILTEHTTPKQVKRMSYVRTEKEFIAKVDSLNPQNQWVPLAKSIDKKDSLGNAYEFEYFENKGNGLVPITHDKYLLEYDAKGRLIKETQGSFFDGKVWDAWRKFEYDGFVPCKEIK